MHLEKLIGFSCAYTPIALIHAAGFRPYRILPDMDCTDQAGHLLHDNLCPHVKRILDRAMGDHIPPLEGMVFMNSCDAMRRLYDAWLVARPDVKAVLIDLPTTVNERSVAFFRDEIQQLAATLAAWGGASVGRKQLMDSIDIYNRIAGYFERLREKMQTGRMQNASIELQKAYNGASCEHPENVLKDLEELLARPLAELRHDGVPVYLFGNMLPEPEAFSLFESCGAAVMAEDMCTGSRLFTPMDTKNDIFLTLSESILNRPPCARTHDDANPGRLSEDIASKAKACGAKGVIGYTAKFCDPYIARLPGVRKVLRDQGLPFLFLEGDLTMRSMGQHKTRIEAFIEMLR